MGLSLSLLLSAWNEILWNKFFGLTDTIETVIVRSLSVDRERGDKLVMEKSMSFKRQESKEADFESYDSSKNTVPKKKSSNSLSLMGKNHERMQIKKPTLVLPKPVILFSPRPVSELDAAATKLQKVYKSYRTRRNLADCAVVVEELWWKALDFAALKRSSVSFFNIEKPETALSRWARARTRAAKVGKGLSKDENAQKLALQHWLEAVSPYASARHSSYLI
jgi:hypothetical protein